MANNVDPDQTAPISVLDPHRHGCILPGLGTYHFSPILLPTRKSGAICHLENGGNKNFTEAFVTLIVTR